MSTQTILDRYPVEMQFVNQLLVNGFGIQHTPLPTSYLTFKVTNFDVDKLQKTMSETKWEKQGDTLFPLRDGDTDCYFIQLSEEHSFEEEILGVLTHYLDDNTYELDLTSY